MKTQGAVPLLYVDTEGFAIDVNAPGFIEPQLKLVGRKLTSEFIIQHHDSVEHLSKLKHPLSHNPWTTNLLAHESSPAKRLLYALQFAFKSSMAKVNASSKSSTVIRYLSGPAGV